MAAMGHSDVTGPTRRVSANHVALGLAALFAAGVIAVAISRESPDEAARRYAREHPQPPLPPRAEPAAPAPEPVAPAIDVTAADLHAAYSANEVAADNLYRNKVLRVTGKVASFDKDFTGDVVIKLRTRNEFEPVMAALDPEDAGPAASLRRGAIATVGCFGGMRVMGSPTLKLCEILPPDGGAVRADEARRRNARRPRVIESDGTVRYLDGR